MGIDDTVDGAVGAHLNVESDFVYLFLFLPLLVDNKYRLHKILQSFVTVCLLKKRVKANACNLLRNKQKANPPFIAPLSGLALIATAEYDGRQLTSHSRCIRRTIS